MAPIATDTVNGHYARENSTLEPIAICGMSCRLPGNVDSESSFWDMLVEKRTGQTPKVPRSRFNIDAHLHENLERPGSFNVEGGYFLNGQPEDFDPGFFNMTPIEAQWLDPQQRRILEVSYEALVSAGLTLESVSGSNTAVFIGSFTADYQQMSIRDPDFRHNYAATGVDPGIISNRIGNTFNLKGPSFTINTACSSSIYALHNACHALHARDCDAAIVGGVNLILTVDQHMNTAKLGILSPTSTCHTFDASADGYGRAEGAGALYIKRLSDAIRDGDPVRAVIRSTAVNTNGKVEGMGITHPSVEGQERVIRTAYKRAGLDPNLTVYAELHGTGTPVGDPIEVRAVANAMNDTRSKAKPLMIGALKPNIGHSEAASGIFAVMKAALMTEAAVIPGVALFKNLNPQIHEKDLNVRVHSDTAPWPKDSAFRRASVSSFGYGGTNGHVIVESVDALYPLYRHAKQKSLATYDHFYRGPLLVCFSAHDKPTLARNVKAIAEVASKYYLADLAHTLNLHRTMFSHRAFSIIREGHEASNIEYEALAQGVLPKQKARKIGFLFTGQGAQWVGMFKAALENFPVVRGVISRLDHVLSHLQPRPSFSILEMLTSGSPDSVARINDADVAQPLCTAIQIALVDLFARWNISPVVSIGHSSGEIGAAYAAGLISAPEAIIVAFCRGRAVAAASSPGSMLAVGLGPEEVKDVLPSDPADVCVACENSPSSVTLSGRTDKIAQLKEELTARGIFARELKTGRAYHSSHMAPVSAEYDKILATALDTLTERDLTWRQHPTDMISSVTGQLLDLETLTAGYWSANLRQKVCFNTAIQHLGADKERFGEVTVIIEIGPHAALSGPFKQVCLSNKFDRFTYIPSLVRKTDDTEKILSVAGSLFINGYPVDLEEVNSEGYQSSHNSMIRKPKTEYLLVDLPPYQWNYEKRYWAEPRASSEQRSIAYPRHDLLGSRVTGLSDSSRVWRNLLRHRDVPWLKDHSLGGTPIFPAAGYLAMAIEGLRQVREAIGETDDGFTLRDIIISKALMLAETDDGVEIVTTLREPQPTSPEWHSFSIESYTHKTWTLHCTGMVSACQGKGSLYRSIVDSSALHQRVSGKTWYSAFSRVGFDYTNSFQQVQSVRTKRDVPHAAGDVVLRIDSGLMKSESRSIIHPSTIDACLHLIIISIHSGKHKEMPWGVVPVQIEEVSIFNMKADDINSIGGAVAWTDRFEERCFNTHTQLSSSDGRLLLDIKNLTCVPYEAAIPAGATSNNLAAQPFSIVSWKPDDSSLSPEQLTSLLPCDSKPVDSIIALIDLLNSRQPSWRGLFAVQSVSSEYLDSDFSKAVQSPSRITIGSGDHFEEADLADKTKNFHNVTPLSDLFSESGMEESFDLVLVDSSTTNSQLYPGSFMPLLKPGGWLVYTNEPLEDSALSSPATRLGQLLITRKHEPKINEFQEYQKKVSLLSYYGKDNGLAQTLHSQGYEVSNKSLVHFNPEIDKHVIIDDSDGTLLLSVGPSEFQAIKNITASASTSVWLTRGVKEGKSAGGGMLEGFLRTLRSEQASFRAVLLDADMNESMDNVGEAIMDKLISASTKESGHDTEFWLHNGILHCPRVLPNNDLNTEWSLDTKVSTETTLPRNMLLKSMVIENKVLFEERQMQGQLTKGEVEIQVLASQLGLHDGSRLLCIGKITGADSDPMLIGRLCLTISQGGLCTILRTMDFAVVDNELAARTTPTILLSLLAQLNCLQGLSSRPYDIEQGTNVLLLPSPKVITNLVMQIAQIKGWRLSVVNQPQNATEEKDSLPRLGKVYQSTEFGHVLSAIESTMQNSSSAVIAHGMSASNQEAWRRMSNGGRFFVLFNDNTTDLAPDPLPFTRGASFIPIKHATPIKSSMESTLLLANRIRFDDALVSDLSHAIDVGDLLVGKQSLPNEIVSFDYGKSRILISPTPKSLALSPDASYLMVGCLGGLGRSLTQWMMERGAKHFVFISRSGADKPEAARVVDQIKAQGGAVSVFRADAADDAAVLNVISEVQTTNHPIRGVVHAAMVLKDGMFEQMDYESFVSSIVPKAKGALSIHNALEKLDVSPDFFVMTSSISAVLGNMGQSNYSAANSLLDYLALQRTVAGKAGVSLVLPMVLDVGVVAENDAIETSLRRKGLYGINETEMLRGFEVAMSHKPFKHDNDSESSNKPLPPFSSQLIMGMDTSELANAIGNKGDDVYWYRDSRFCHIKKQLEEIATLKHNGKSNGFTEGSFSSALEAAKTESPEVVIKLLSKHIVKKVGSILMIPEDDFDLVDRSIASYGLDSMIGAELRTWLFKEFKLDYPFQKLLSPTLTVTALAEVISKIV